MQNYSTVVQERGQNEVRQLPWDLSPQCAREGVVPDSVGAP